MSACLVAQDSDPIAIKNWPAPLYWQQSAEPSDTQAAASKSIMRSATVVTSTLVFVGIVPCRLVDTRDNTLPAPFGPPTMAANQTRTITVPTGTRCNIPSTAQAYSFNFTVVPAGFLGYLSAWPTPNRPTPDVSILNSTTGQTIANAAVIPAGTNGSVDVLVTNVSDVIMDINGYYIPLSATLLTGTAAAPALTFSNSATGLFSTAANTVSVGTNGVSRLTVRADGDLDLPGSIRKNGLLFLHNLGIANTALGLNALINNTQVYNTAVGLAALSADTNGFQNTALGAIALQNNIGGTNNVAVGYSALLNNTAGNSNTAIGPSAGLNTTGDFNIMIGNSGLSADANTIRIGDSNQNRAFIAGISGKTTGLSGAVNVMVDTNGQLGTVSSSRRFKEDISDMADASSGLLRLRPVTFRYKRPYEDGSKPLDYGLIAEEVAQVYPGLVVKTADGQVETVQYQKLTPMLLNEVQKQHDQIDRQAEQIRRQQDQNRQLADRLAALEALLQNKPPER